MIQVYLHSLLYLDTLPSTELLFLYLPHSIRKDTFSPDTNVEYTFVFKLRLSTFTADMKVLAASTPMKEVISNIVICVWAREERDRKVIMKRYLLREESKVWQKKWNVQLLYFSDFWNTVSVILMHASFDNCYNHFVFNIASSCAWMIIIFKHQQTLQWN